MGKSVEVKIKETAELLYQNREREGITAVAGLLQTYQTEISRLSEEQMKDCGNFALLMLRELLENYQNEDMLGMADCLMGKSLLFAQYING